MTTTATIEKLATLLAVHTDVSEGRRLALAAAIELGADDAGLTALCEARRTSRNRTIVLPAQRFEHLSRGRGWARKGKGDSAEWGTRVAGGYRVGPGHWVVGGNDGFTRKGEDTWTVKSLTVGTETWTIAS